ncbi:MAG: TrbG/VirB9 family P-type conjugative transfer protein, partial [Longimicrobiales bacterium]
MSAPRHLTLGLLCVVLGVGSPVRAQSPPLVNSRSLDEFLSAIRPYGVAKQPRRVTTYDNRIEAAYRDCAQNGRARVVVARHEGGRILFPFGHTRPVVRCPRLNACVIGLEPGEALTDQPLSGDTERWIIETSVAGGDTLTPLVVIKPQDCDLATNLVIPTDRRVYELSLVSDSCKDTGEPQTYSRQVTFWYPDEMLAARAAESERAVEDSVGASGSNAATVERAPEVELNHDYDIDRGWFLNRKRYPWMPVDVFDDGTRTYIVLPETARTAELPILYILEGGERHVLNYALY